MHGGYKLTKPNVWSVKWPTSTTSTAVTSAYGLKRWFPVEVAEAEIAGYVTAKAAYASAKSSYDTLKTAYEKANTDNAAAIEGASMFSPAELVTVPARPCKPSALAAYGGLRMAKWAATKDYKWEGAMETTMNQVLTSGVVTAGLAANDFVVDGEYGGGWGAWTMGLLPIVKDYGKSFGVFGTGPAADTPLAHSYNQE